MEKKCIKCGFIKSLDNFYKCSECKMGYRNDCKDCLKEYGKIWRSQNPDSNRIWREKNFNHDKERKNKHYHNNKENYLKRSKEYRIKNKDEVNKYVREYRKKRLLEDIIFKLTFIVRSRIKNHLRGREYNKQGKSFELVGCSPKELKEHLEKQFVDGMNWGNHGEWHIDHIIPLSSAKTEEDLYKLCYYTNLRPLWAEDNLKKSNKII
jgi:hypothetical protein